MKLYPINLNVNNKLCVVIGGGNVARRKIESLLEAGAQVKVVSSEFGVRSSEFMNLEIVERPYRYGDLVGAFLAIAATDDEEVNKQIAQEAKEQNVLLNVVDVPQLSDFYVPSVVRRGDLAISISTSGKYPALSKKLRKELEAQFGVEYGQYLEIMGQARNKVISKFADVNKRKEVLQEILKMPLIELVKQGKTEEAMKRIERIVGG